MVPFIVPDGVRIQPFCPACLNHLLAKCLRNIFAYCLTPTNALVGFRLFALFPRMIFAGLPDGKKLSTITRRNMLIESRLTSFLSGDWRLLLEEHVGRVKARNDAVAAARLVDRHGPQSTLLPPRHDDPFESDEDVAASKHNRALIASLRKRSGRAELLTRLGELSRAGSQLTSDAVPAPRSESSLDKLRDKHPPRRWAIPNSLLRPTIPPKRLELTVDSVLKALRTSAKGSAGGCDGWTADHLRYIALDDTEILILLTQVCQLFADGTIPPDAIAVQGASRLIGITKGVRDVRPIAIGTVLRRLSGRAAMIQLRTDIEEYLMPFQLGVSVRCGVETVPRVVQTWLESHPDHAALKIDIKNAFNSVSRRAILEQLNAVPQFQCLIPMVRMFYEHDGDLWYEMDATAKRIASAEGVAQGDPISGLLFCLAIHPCIRRAAALVGHDPARGNTGLCACIADDVTLCGTDAALAAAFPAIAKDFLENAGCVISIDKCKVVAPSATLTKFEKAAADFASAQTKPPLATVFVEIIDAATTPDPVERGMFLLSVPVGTQAYMAKEAKTVFTQNSLLPDRLREYLTGSKQCCLLLLRRCAAPQSIYWLRCLPPQFCFGPASTLDITLLDCFGTIICSKVTDGSAAASQIALPTSLGGIGLTRLRDVCAAAYLSSITDSAILVNQICPVLSSIFESALASAVARHGAPAVHMHPTANSSGGNRQYAPSTQQSAPIAAATIPTVQHILSAYASLPAESRAALPPYIAIRPVAAASAGAAAQQLSSNDPAVAPKGSTQHKVMWPVHAANAKAFVTSITPPEGPPPASNDAAALAAAEEAARPLALYNSMKASRMVWLDVIPNDEFSMTNSDIIHALCPALRLPLPMFAPGAEMTRCTKASCARAVLDPISHIAHLCGCCGKGDLTRRHNVVQREAVVPICKQFAGHPSVDQNQIIAEGFEIDVLVAGLTSGRLLNIDIVVTEPTAATYVLPAAASALATAASAHKGKLDHYRVNKKDPVVKPSEGDFQPWSIEATTGGIGRDLQGYLYNAALEAAYAANSTIPDTATEQELKRVRAAAAASCTSWTRLLTLVTVRASARWLAESLRRCRQRSRTDGDVASLPVGELARRRAAPALYDDISTSLAARSHYSMTLPRHAGGF